MIMIRLTYNFEKASRSSLWPAYFKLLLENDIEITIYMDYFSCMLIDTAAALHDTHKIWQC